MTLYSLLFPYPSFPKPWLKIPFEYRILFWFYTKYLSILLSNDSNPVSVVSQQVLHTKQFNSRLFLNIRLRYNNWLSKSSPTERVGHEFRTSIKCSKRIWDDVRIVWIDFCHNLSSILIWFSIQNKTKI